MKFVRYPTAAATRIGNTQNENHSGPLQPAAALATIARTVIQLTMESTV